MDKNVSAIITRLKDICESYPGERINEFLDEAFEYYLCNTTQSGKPLAEEFFLMSEIKRVFNEASRI